MGSIKLSYTKLSKSHEEEEDDDDDDDQVKRRSSSSRIRWLRLRSSGSGKRYNYWRRPRVIRIARLRRVFKKKVKVVRNAVDKVITRLKEGKPFFGELFAGNYMFMQVSPSPTMLLMPLTNKKGMDKLKVLKLRNGSGLHLSLQ